MKMQNIGPIGKRFSKEFIKRLGGYSTNILIFNNPSEQQLLFLGAEHNVELRKLYDELVGYPLPESTLEAGKVMLIAYRAVNRASGKIK